MQVFRGSLRLISFILGVLMGFTHLSCSSSSEKKNNDLSVEIVSGYAKLVFATYSDALQTAQLLQSSIDTFLLNPNTANQIKAQEAWITARKYYGQTEVFRFYDGPIDNGETGVEGLLNAWPLDEVYVDYVAGDDNSGIINDIKNFPEITTDLLVSMNEKGGEENISCGYHAIEFMLWGQDTFANSAGRRPVADFVANSLINERRRTYLKLCSELLVKHLQQLTNQWNPEIAGNYYATFISENPSVSMQKILTGMGVLAKVEMAGERMFTAYDNAGQEDEQSCFSDNTKADLMNNFGGIINVFYGTYVQFDKTNLQVKNMGNLVQLINPELFAQTDSLIKKCNNDIQNIYQPFDQAITLEDKRPQVMNAILSVQKIGDQMANIAAALGESINVNANN